MIALRACFLFLLMVSTMSFGKSIGPPMVDTRKIEAELKDSREHFLSSEAKKREVLFNIFNLNKKIKKIAEEKGELNSKVLNVKSDSRTIGKKIREIEAQLQGQKKVLEKGMRVLYKVRGQGQLRALFSSSTPQELERNIRFLTIVSQRNMEQIVSYKKALADLSDRRSELTGKVKKLLVLKKEVSRNEEELHSEQKKKSKFIGSIEQERDWYLQKIKEIREKTKRIDIDEDSILSRSMFYEEKGQLSWPTEGVIVRPYGLYDLGPHGSKLNHKGIQFSDQSSPSIRAVARGKVAFVGEVQGHRRIIILDHGDSYYSIYGNLSQVKVVSKQRVDAHQEIANTSQGLYFEVRHYSTPEDPMKWLKLREVKISAHQPTDKGQL